MDEVAKPITKEFCKVVSQNGGDILDVGYGLGYSANFFIDMGVESYTCIEKDYETYKNALRWSKNRSNITILYGDWIDVIPRLNKKFDGIFMDTYGDDYEKYKSFERYCTNIANENCILSIYEYGKVRPIEELNRKRFYLEQGNYELLLKPYHHVSWTYFSLSKFTKEKVCDIKRNIIPDTLCNQIISQNKYEVKFSEKETLIDGVLHRRRFSSCKLKPNNTLFQLLNEKVLTRYQSVDFTDVTCWFVKYDIKDLYDRHVETLKGIDIESDEQYTMTIDIYLNNGYQGGELLVYEDYTKNNKKIYSKIQTRVGDVVTYKPYQHSKYSEVIEGEKYQIIILLRNSDLKKQII